MRQLVLATSALAVVALSAPVTVPAHAEDKVIIKEHREHRDHVRFFDRFRRHHDHDRKEVIIKKGDHHDHDHD